MADARSDPPPGDPAWMPASAADAARPLRILLVSAEYSLAFYREVVERARGAAA